MSKKKPETVHVGLLVDETGSMMRDEPAVIGGVNEFVENLRPPEADDQGARDARHVRPAWQRPGRAVRSSPASRSTRSAPLGPGDYAPRGATPLNDAVVKTIRKMAAQVKKGDRAMLVVLTDGLENASETPTATSAS